MIQKFLTTILFSLMILVHTSCTMPDFCESLASNIPVVNYFSAGNCTVKIKSNKYTNNGAPFYFVVKSTEFHTFLSEDYAKIESLLNDPPKDDPSFGIYCIIPGKDQMFSIERSAEVTSLGFYFLFTKPGNSWKQSVNIEGSAPVIRIVLDGNEVSLG